MASKIEAASLAIHLEDGDVIASLVAAIEELPGGVKVEAAWIIPASPFVSDVLQCSVFADGKNPNAVMKPVARVNKPAIC